MIFTGKFKWILINFLKSTKGEGAVNSDSSVEEVVDSEVIQLVSFMLDEVEYGVDILSVHEIFKISRNDPGFLILRNFIKGVINLRGNVLPVVDVRLRFGFSQRESITDLTRIIVVETGGKQVGPAC